MTPEKICQECGEDLRCVHTGCIVYVAHTGVSHSADLFMCFDCLTFHIFGFNAEPMVMWRMDDSIRVDVTPVPDVVLAGDYLLIPYGDGSPFSFVAFGTADIVPLPASLDYMRNKCGHVSEIAAYLEKGGP